MPSTTAITIAVSASSIVAGMRSRMSCTAGTLDDERLAEVAGEGAGEEGPVLPPQRLVETQRGRRARDLGLVGLRIDQDVDRVADRVDAGEHQRRHHEQHQHALEEPAQEEGQHASRR